ncbi:MAG: hypothetical protein Q4G68_14030 [Planctomycetia bacterium]|nr:hypothetical protein [Planctomycetia bacterium]
MRQKRVQWPVGFSSCFFLLLFFYLAAGLCQGQSQGTPWQAADGQRHILPGAAKTGEIREDKTVGIFYFLWNSPVSNIAKAPYREGPYDISDIFQRDPDIMTKPDSPLWGGNGQFHFWGEPLFGYYRADDPWIMRRHIQLLADAGVDVLIFDTTNALTYPEIYLPLCATMMTIRQEGGRTPQITFMLNTQAGATAEKLWREIYSTGQYDELLFKWDGKPLLIADPDAITSAALKENLTLRKAHWPFEMKNTHNAWHWEATYPQPYSWSEREDVPEQVNVSVAQNLSRATGAVENMSSGQARGRSFCKDQIRIKKNATDQGLNFTEQWRRALALSPPFVMITGWNEWIAGRWRRGEEYVFVDQFDREYSRDIEPMKGGHFDNYYLLMMAGIRHYKGTPPLPQAPEPKTIPINDDFSAWDEVEPCFTDHTGETIPRDFPGVGGTHYVNRTGRNDLLHMKATCDEKNLYFLLETKEELTPDSLDGLCLLINTDGNYHSGWIGGDWLLGRHYQGNSVSLEKYKPGGKRNSWNWQSGTTVSYCCKGNKLHIAIPMKDLALRDSAAPLRTISFKWLDNIPETMTLEDLYTRGDVAPESRFFYSFKKQ